MIDSNSLILNKILAAKGLTYIINAKSDGRHIGFIGDLIKNYRKAYWISFSHDNTYSFPLTLAEEIIEDTQEYDELVRMSFIEQGYGVGACIVNAVLSYIARQNFDSILVIDGIGDSNKEFDKRYLDLLISNCPSNMTMVFVAEKMFDIRFDYDEKKFPRIVCSDELYVKTDDFSNEYNFMPDSIKSFIKCFSIIGDLERKFIEDYYRDAFDFLQDYSIKNKFTFYQKNGRVITFSKDYDNLADENFSKNDYYLSFIKNLFNYYYNKNDTSVIRALEIAINANNEELIRKTLKKLFKSDKFYYLLIDYIELNKKTLDLSGDIYVLCYNIIAKFFQAKAQEAMTLARKAIRLTPGDSIIAHRILYWLARTSINANREEINLEHYGKYLKKRTKEKIEFYENDMIGSLELLPYLIQYEDLSETKAKIQAYREEILSTTNENKYWYDKCLYVVAEAYYYLGQYESAISMLSTLYIRQPFFIAHGNAFFSYLHVEDFITATLKADSVLKKSREYEYDYGIGNASIMKSIIALRNDNGAEAISIAENVMRSDTQREDESIILYAFNAIINATVGDAEFARNRMVSLVLRNQEKNINEKSEHAVLVTQAYCYWKKRDFQKASEYAESAVNLHGDRLLSCINLAVYADCKIVFADYSVVSEVISKTLKHIELYRLEVFIKPFSEVFTPLLQYAKRNELSVNLLREIEKDNMTYTGKQFSQGVKIKLFGNSSVMIKGKEIPWKTKKAKDLFLTYYLKGEEGMDRNEIMSTFWGDYVYTSALNNLKTTNNMIRNTLKENNIQHCLSYINSRYVLKIVVDNDDYVLINNEMDCITDELPVKNRLNHILRIFDIYGTGFAIDVSTPYFDGIRENIIERIVHLEEAIIEKLLCSKDYSELKRQMMLLRKANLKERMNNTVKLVEKELDRDENK